MPVDTTKKFEAFIKDLFENEKYAYDEKGHPKKSFVMSYKNFDILMRLYFGSNRITLKDYLVNLETFNLIKVSKELGVTLNRDAYEDYITLVERKKKIERDF